MISDLVGDIITVGGILVLFSTSDWLLLGVFALNLGKVPSLPTVKGIPSNLVLKEWSKTLTTTTILPAGSVFSFKQLSAESRSGVVSMLIDYK
jgi:hypothetical protein